MSLITSCPACGTMFKVVPDQLKISGGWVRCGHCGEIFDAARQLSATPEVPEPQPPAPPPEVAAVPETRPELAPEVARQDSEASAPVEPLSASPAATVLEAGPVADLEPEPEAAPEPAVPPAPEPEPEATPEPEPETATVVHGRPDDEVFSPAFIAPSMEEARRSDAPTVSEGREAAVYDGFADTVDGFAATVAEAPSHLGGLPPEAELMPPLDDVSFVRQARRRAFWRRPAVRVTLLVLSLGLGVLLAGQVAVHDRDRLAAARPALKPWLEAVCSTLGCTLAPPRQIDSVVIESSSFSRSAPDAFRLNFTVRNAAAHEVAAPALELTLTDTQDQPVVRRVLQPADLRGPSVLAAGSEWSASLTMDVATDPGGARVAGYRLLAFYP